MSKRDVGRSFSRAASSYDSVADVQRVMADALVELVASLPTPPAALLEVGCGTGILSQRLIETLPPLRSFRLVDLSSEMLAEARSRLEGRDPFCALSYLQADGELLSLPREVDLWISGATVQWFGDLPGALRRIQSELSPGGRIAFSCFGPGSLCELYETYAEVHGNERIKQARFWSAEELVELLDAAGFSVVASQVGVEQSESPHLPALLKRIKAMGASYRPDTSSQLTRESLRRWGKLYAERYPSPSGGILSSWEWVALVAESKRQTIFK